jgi:hypothetical protein
MQLHVDVQCSLRSVLIDTDWREYVHLTYHGNIFSYVSCKKKTHMMWRPKSSVFAWLKTHFSSNVVQGIIQQYFTGCLITFKHSLRQILVDFTFIKIHMCIV